MRLLNITIIETDSHGDVHKEVGDEQPVAVVFTDGACEPNPGSGGWAAVICRDREEEEISGSVNDTTNNRMEVRAVKEALSYLDIPHRVFVFTDSEYTKGVLSKSYTVNANRELIESTWEEMERHDVHLYHVKGHSGDVFNERADNLANKEALK